MMNEIPAELRRYRNQLRSAVARDLADHDRRRGATSRRLAVPVAVAACAVGVALIVVFGAGSQAPSADAAILHRVAAALTPPPGTILHEQAQVTLPGVGSTTYEVWMQADSPYAYRVIKWGSEGSWNGSTYSNYDPASNTITIEPAPPAGTRPKNASVDFAATLRSLVQSGEATVDGTTTIDGVRAYKLIVTGSSDPSLIGTAYVATADYQLLEIETAANSGKVVYETYQYLPATTANLGLLDLAAQHPGATIVNGSSSTDTDSTPTTTAATTTTTPAAP
jgi:hypothetical protein